LSDDEVSGLRIENLRGKNMDIFEMESYFNALLDSDWVPGLVVIDAFYRCIPKGVSENDNAQMTQLFNQLDLYASRVGCRASSHSRQTRLAR